MPVVLGSDFRARAGHHPSTDVGTAYRLRSLAVQLDQRVGGEATGGIKTFWQNPAFPPSTFPSPARVIKRRDSSRAPDGDYLWQWVFSRWTWGMLSHWETTFLPSGIESGPITVATYTERNAVMWLQAVTGRPRVLQVINGGFINVAIEFEAGEEIAAPP